MFLSLLIIYLTENNILLYGSKKVNMPKPELYVIFTGEKPKNPPDIISLSKDFFDGEKIAVDAEVKVLYQEETHTTKEVPYEQRTVFTHQKILIGKNVTGQLQ